MNPLDNPKAYDSFLLAGTRSPGILRYGNPKREEGWEIVTAKGAAGGETVNNGTKLAKFQFELFLWRAFHYREWEQFKLLFKSSSKEGAQQQALDIYHPILAEIGVTSVVVAAWTPAVPQRGGGSIVQIEFLEYAPSKAKDVGRPKGSKGGGFTGVNLLAGIGSLDTGGGTGGLNAAFGDDAKKGKKTSTERVSRADPNAAQKQRIRDKTALSNSLSGPE